MDDIEKEYFKKIKPFANDLNDRRKELADSRIKMFVATLCRELFEYNEKFDLILGAGNSGLYMTKIAKLTYEKLGIKTPHVLDIPLFRFKEARIFNDNSSLEGFVSDFLKDKDVQNILFVDTEIMQGISAKEAIELIIKTNPTKSLRLNIIAENHFFEWHYNISNLAFSFFAYSPLVQGLNDNIAYFVPEDLRIEMTKVLGLDLAYNHAMAILVGGGLKKKDENDKGYFDTSVIENLREKIENFDERRKKLFDELDVLISEGIADYRAGKIEFRFV